MIFWPKERGNLPSTVDRLPVRARLKMEIDSSGFVPWLQNIFAQADQIANLTNPADWRDSEVAELPNHDTGDQTLIFQAWQIDLAALANQENAGLAVIVSFEYGLDCHKIQIRGHEITYSGKAPASFLNNSPELTAITESLIQAMMQPMILT